MTSVGTFEAKTHLTHLLERVAKGERMHHHQSGQACRHACPSWKPITSGTRPESAERCSRTGTGSSTPLAVHRFGTSLTRGTGTERFALGPFSPSCTDSR